ncbi:MAG: hypothetical protein AAGC85_21980, partial [Bacteroidota bacterium]
MSSSNNEHSSFIEELKEKLRDAREDFSRADSASKKLRKEFQNQVALVNTLGSYYNSIQGTNELAKDVIAKICNGKELADSTGCVGENAVHAIQHMVYATKVSASKLEVFNQGVKALNTSIQNVTLTADGCEKIVKALAKVQEVSEPTLP